MITYKDVIMKKIVLSLIICVPVTLLNGCVYDYYANDYTYTGSRNLYSAGYGYGYSDYSLGAIGVDYTTNGYFYNRTPGGITWYGTPCAPRGIGWRASDWYR